MSPFDKARYERLLQGLEASEVQLADLENEMTIGAEYYGPTYSLPVERLKSAHYVCAPLSDVCWEITDGDHGSADYADEGVRFVLSEAVKEGWIDESRCRFVTPEHARKLPRSSLRTADVLVTKTGMYFGKSAVIDQALVGANTIAHVGILRVKQDRGIDPHYLSTFLNCGYGQAQLRRRGIKATRPEIKLLEFADVLVPRVSGVLQRQVKETILQARMQRERSNLRLEEASSILVRSLGLDTWKPVESGGFVRKSRDAFDAGRLDAEFFAPRVAGLLALLGRDGLTIADVAPARHNRFTPAATGSFRYIEIGSLESDGTAQSEEVLHQDAPSRATQHVCAGDVITSTVRPIRRLSAVIGADQDGCVCSSGFVVLQPQTVSSEVLLTYLRLRSVCELMDLHTSATMYPAISEVDLLALPIPSIPDATQRTIEKSVRAARQTKARAMQLLDAAKRAVEIAIEDSESAATQYLEAFDER